MKIFMTGATGFLGNEILHALLTRKHQITALVRSPQKASSLPPEVKAVPGSVENPDSYREELRGLDVFLHVAALVKMWVRDRKEFDRTNVEALEKNIELAEQMSIPKFVYTSSFIALGPSDGKPICEADSRRSESFHNDYERTKYLGDQVARRYLSRGYPIYILYPGVIYGPGNLTDGNIVAKSVIPLLNGKMPLGLSLRVWSYAFVRDIVQAFITVIETDPPSHRYILGGDNRSGPEFYQVLHEVTGVPPPRVNIPISLAVLSGYGEYLLAVLFGREPRLLTHEVAQIYKHSWAYDASLAVQELGYRITPLKEGLIEMVGWLKNAGFVR